MGGAKRNKRIVSFKAKREKGVVASEQSGRDKQYPQQYPTSSGQPIIINTTAPQEKKQDGASRNY